jgi:5-methylcytosine-specific restriction protein A
MPRSRKHAWLRDELILALDLYVREGDSAPTDSRQKVSNLLRALPVEDKLADDPKFRSESAVAHKLANFLALDQPGRGFPHGGAGDARVWAQFASDPTRLAATAASIAADIESGRPAPPTYDDEDDPDEAEAAEGRLLTRRHRERERNPMLAKKKKDQVRKQRDGKLTCEACGFDFAEHYGERGDGFIECHHTVFVRNLRPGSRTKLSDLVLLCSNCHRIVHRRSPWLTMGELRNLVSGQLGC